jgi:hypothetical protein
MEIRDQIKTVAAAAVLALPMLVDASEKALTASPAPLLEALDHGRDAGKHPDPLLPGTEHRVLLDPETDEYVFVRTVSRTVLDAPSILDGGELPAEAVVKGGAAR